MRIIRLLVTLFLGITTLLIFLGVALIVIVKFNNKSFIAGQIKEKLIRNSLLVSLINLNEPGDGRYMYMNIEGNIQPVNLYYLKDEKPDIEVEVWINEMIQLTSGKRTVINKLVLSKAVKSAYNKEDLNRIREKLENTIEGVPVLNVIYLNSFDDAPTNVGITIHRDTIFIFKSTLNKLTESDFKLKRLEKSTLMHEWGHLLGFDHAESDDCIMSEKVEVYDSHWMKGREIPVEYCTETLRAHERKYN